MGLEPCRFGFKPSSWLCGLGQVQYLSEPQFRDSSVCANPLLRGLSERGDRVFAMSCSAAGWCGGPMVGYVWVESQGASPSASVPISWFIGRRSWVSFGSTAESVPSAPGMQINLSVSRVWKFPLTVMEDRSC